MYLTQRSHIAKLNLFSCIFDKTIKFTKHLTEIEPLMDSTLALLIHVFTLLHFPHNSDHLEDYLTS